MFRHLKVILRPNFSINSSWLRYENGYGEGTVKNPDGVFSDREAAMENRYFRNKQAEDLKRLKNEMKERRRRKKEKIQQQQDDDQNEGDEHAN